MSCKYCGSHTTIRAHLIPRAFAEEVKTDPGEKHLLIHAGDGTYQSSNTGTYDPDLLCAKCDGLLGQNEGYVFNLLKDARTAMAPARSLLRMVPVAADRVIRFAAGLSWKYGVTQFDDVRVPIGPYTNLLKTVAFGQDLIPPTVDAMAMQIFTGDDQTYFYRTPFPDRVAGVNVIRFSVGGFVFLLKLDKRPNPYSELERCWLRNRNEATFWVAPAELVTEWTKHYELRQQRNVRSYFERMISRRFNYSPEQ